MMKKCFLIFTSLLLTICAQAQLFDMSRNLNFSNHVEIGMNVGASMPIPISERVSNMSWTPPFAPYIGWRLFVYGNHHFGVSTGVFVSVKGMTANASVYQLFTSVNIDGVKTEGYFTGRNNTNVKNLYASFPVELSYVKDYYRISLGLLMSKIVKKSFTGYVGDGYLRRNTPVGDRIDIVEAPFDFSEEVRNFDVAVTLNFYRKLYERWFVSCGLDMSITPMTNNSFTGMPFSLYNVYGHVGLSYRFGK